MQSTFRFFRTGPSSGTRIFTRHNSTGALLAADAREIAVMERIIYNIIFADVIPYILSRPVRNRIKFDQSEFIIVLYLLELARVGA